jgi:hypothetical protein
MKNAQNGDAIDLIAIHDQIRIPTHRPTSQAAHPEFLPIAGRSGGRRADEPVERPLEGVDETEGYALAGLTAVIGGGTPETCRAGC